MPRKRSEAAGRINLRPNEVVEFNRRNWKKVATAFDRIKSNNEALYFKAIDFPQYSQLQLACLVRAVLYWRRYHDPNARRATVRQLPNGDVVTKWKQEIEVAILPFVRGPRRKNINIDFRRR